MKLINGFFYKDAAGVISQAALTSDNSHFLLTDTRGVVYKKVGFDDDVIGLEETSMADWQAAMSTDQLNGTPPQATNDELQGEGVVPGLGRDEKHAVAYSEKDREYPEKSEYLQEREDRLKEFEIARREKNAEEYEAELERRKRGEVLGEQVREEDPDTISNEPVSGESVQTEESAPAEETLPSLPGPNG